MSNNKLPGPSASSPMQQHVCSTPESIAALRDAIEVDPSLLEMFVNRHVLTIKDFNAPLLSQIFRLAELRHDRQWPNCRHSTFR